MTSLYAIPAAFLLLVTLACAVAAAGAGQHYVHRRFRSHEFIAHNEVGGIIIAVAGTLFAVMLGFLTVDVWQQYTDAQQVVVHESNGAIDAWHASVGLPPAVRSRVRNDMVRYANIMIEREWPAMREGKSDEEAAMVSMDSFDAVGGFSPANMRESNAQLMTLQQLDVMHDARQQRIAINGSGVSWFEWVVLLIGAVCVICFCWLFGVSSSRIQFLMTSTVVTIIVSILVLLFELQYPFRSDVGIGPQGWSAALAHIREMQQGEMPNMR